MASLPKQISRIKMNFNAPALESPADTLAEMLENHANEIRPGAKVGVAVGSRGIYGIAGFVRTVIDFLKDHKAEPVILTAMGSHGGANNEGQTEVLASYGVTPEAMGAPILANMKVDEIGPTKNGHKVYFDREALKLDGIILLNRIKPHTDFHERIESGLLKQMVIGLGNHVGAQYVHTHGLAGLKKLIPEIAAVCLQKAPVLFGIAVVENAKDTTAELHILKPAEMDQRESQLIKRATELMPRLPFDWIDVLVVQAMGKNISGVGIDSNITGRRFIRQDPEPDQFFIGRVACLDLTEESHGNALGVGLADVITKRLYDKIDFEYTYANVITSGFLERGMVPIVQKSDKDCIQTSLNSCSRRVGDDDAMIAQIPNTLELGEMLVSGPLLERIDQAADWELIRQEAYAFSPQGELLTLVGDRL